MDDFALHNQETAPEGAKPLLDNSVKMFGMIPNLHAVMAESPNALEAYQKMTALFQSSSLSPAEQDVVWLTVSRLNSCDYCIPAHSFIAVKLHQTSGETVTALRQGTALADAKLEALRLFTEAVIRRQGKLDPEEVAAFFAAGFSRRNLLDVMLGVAHKTFSNYTNHIAHTPIDEPFKAYADDQ
ncbi:MAG: carboxymuconolactone decarboxylase family protein [Candidatus Competibacterales bacterium]